MGQIRILNTTIFFLLLLFIQETIINRINFPWHSFSIYLSALLVLLAFEDRTGSLVFGFMGGLIMDLAPGSSTPFGQWALVMTLMGYLFAVNRESIGDFTERPLAAVSFISLAAAISMLTFLFIGLLLGQENGGVSHNLSVILANSLWSFFITPVFLPLIIRFRKYSLSSRDLI
jgi:rod shape-determining protein MreD